MPEKKVTDADCGDTHVLAVNPGFESGLAVMEHMDHKQSMFKCQWGLILLLIGAFYPRLGS